MRVCLGGTFNKIHKGHKKLISTAFKFGDNVFVGVTSDEYIEECDEDVEKPFEKRKKQIEDYLVGKGWEAEVKKIGDRFGPAKTDPDFDAIVVSEETEPTAKEINLERKLNDLEQLKIIVIPFIDEE